MNGWVVLAALAAVFGASAAPIVVSKWRKASQLADRLIGKSGESPRGGDQ